MLYIHVPFCASRCAYCDFYSTVVLDKRGQYVHALCLELKNRAKEHSLSRVPSIYIGGGTPSQLSAEQLQRIIETIRENYVIADDAEITMEVNPDDVTAAYLNELKSIGFNRLSMGVQSFHDNLLRVLRRRHDSCQARAAVGLMRKSGFTNISIDLMFGLPGQSIQDWQQDVEEALCLQVPHLSAYSLQWEEGTLLSALRDKGQVQEQTDESCLAMYSYLMDRASAVGYEHYEISNFALPGRRSRHNSGYWHGLPYLGFGPGAHSYDGGRIRRWNSADIFSYLESCGKPDCEYEELSDEELLEELVMTRLRTSDGLSLTEVERRFGSAKLRRLVESAKIHLLHGRLLRQGEILRLSRDAIFVSNDIISDLF